jgi:hypothetical protein
VISLSEVEVVNESEAALQCRVGSKSYWIPRDKIREGTTIQGAGDTGTLVLPRQFAVEWGLVGYDD